MPGGYAHITLSESLRQELYKSRQDYPLLLRAHANRLNFVSLGSLGPDYPYLSIGADNLHDMAWADQMHYRRTTDMLRQGVEMLRPYQGATGEKLLAWFMGYASHVVADGTIHPVVESIVGRYEDHKTEHRICEANQDVFIYGHSNGVHPAYAEHMKIIMKETTDPDTGGMDPEVKEFWFRLLRTVHPDLMTENRPDLDAWHRRFLGRMDLYEDAGMVPLARHLAQLGAALPKEYDREYINTIETPKEAMNYEAVFELGRRNVLRMWQQIENALSDRQATELAQMPNFNLDTGRVGDAGPRVYWG